MEGSFTPVFDGPIPVNQKEFSLPTLSPPGTLSPRTINTTLTRGQIKLPLSTNETIPKISLSNNKLSSYQTLIDRINKSEHVENINNTDKLKWNNQLALKTYYNIKETLGKNPTVLNVDSGGLAIWQKPNGGSYHSFEIRDDTLIKPVVYGGHLIVKFYYPLKSSSIQQLNNMLFSIWYESMSGLISVQCSSLSEAIVIYSLIKMYNDDRIDIKDMTRMYDYYINSNMINYLEEYIMSSE